MTTATTSPTASPTLAHLLDDELDLSPSYLGVYSNHLAMALVALEHLGAGPDVLQATADAHRRGGGSEPRDDRPVLDERLRQVARDGIAETVRARAGALVDAPGTALFHPVIRLGYALDAGHGGQVAAALLDWERRRHPLGPLPPAGERRLRDVAAVLAADPAGTWPRTFDLDGIAGRPELARALHGAAFDERTLDDVSAFAIAAHVTADDFLTLHLVTGARAVRRVAAVLDDGDAHALAAHTLVEMAVVYAAVGAPPLRSPAALDELRRSPLPGRPRIAERAAADHDPHVIKLAEAALAEEERTGDPLYRLAAARVVGLASG